MENFIVLDTETTWQDKVMSIGVVVASGDTMTPIEYRYYIINPEFREGGMYSHVLIRKKAEENVVCTREQALYDIKNCIRKYNAGSLFAYNAAFDRQHLPELKQYAWFDIMRIAAYRQFNPRIPAMAPVCSTGRMKSRYGVQDMFQYLSGDYTYREIHNALDDAMGELRLMQLLSRKIDQYIPMAENPKEKNKDSTFFNF